MKVVVFGATGRVGRVYVDAALQRGHTVTVYTRNSLNVRIKHKNLRVMGGNVSDDNPVREAVLGQELVMVALGPADISRPHSVCADGTRRIVMAMQKYKVPRVIMVGNVGLLPHPSGKMVGEVNLPPFLQFVFADQKIAYQELKESGLDWVMVCPPFMPKGDQKGKYRVAVEAHIPNTKTISVEDCAHFLIKESFDDKHHNARIAIGY